jgi:hypothetical protein
VVRVYVLSDACYELDLNNSANDLCTSTGVHVVSAMRLLSLCYIWNTCFGRLSYRFRCPHVRHSDLSKQFVDNASSTSVCSSDLLDAKFII